MPSFTKRIIKFNLVILVLFIIDRTAKWIALDLLPSEGFFVIPNMTGFILERNQGIAYSLELPPVLLLSVVVILILLLFALIIKAYQKKEMDIIFSLSLIIIGAISNLIDRLRFEYVIDMLVLTSWPVFNLADLFILVGAIWLIIIYIRKSKKEINSEV